jgi:predicted permease
MWLSKLVSLFRRGRLDRDLDDEVRVHLEMATAEYERQGLSPAEARRAARRGFGGLDQMKEVHRDVLTFRWIEDLVKDLTFGVRTLRKRPGFAVVVVITLAIGIGANTTVFSVLDALLLQPLPVHEPARLVSLRPLRTLGALEMTSASYPEYLDYRALGTVFSDLMGWDSPETFQLNTGGLAERVLGTTVTANYFTVLGVVPSLGRVLASGVEGVQGAAPAVVLSDRLWRTRLGGAPDVVGSQVMLNGTSATVIGIAPRDFRGPPLDQRPDFWLPITALPHLGSPDDYASLINTRGTRWLEMMGRLQPGVTIGQAQAAVDVEAARLRDSVFADGSDALYTATVIPARTAWLPNSMRSGVVAFTWLLLAIVGLVLLLACANVANLLLARATARRQEIAIRASLGGGRSRLVRQLLTESTLLALLGGGAGLLLAWWLIDLAASLPIGVDIDLALDGRVLGFTLVVSLLTGLLFGVIPAVQATRPDVLPALKNDLAARGRRRLAPAHSLMVAQVAISLVLLVGAGLFVRTVQNLREDDHGFDPENVLLVSVDLGPPGYEPARGKAFFEQLVDRVQAVPGVRAATVASRVPGSGGGLIRTLAIDGYEPPPGEVPTMWFNRVGTGYFELMGIPLTQGRVFTPRDGADSPKVAIANEAFATQVWPGENPIGKLIDSGRNAKQIVGVVANSTYFNVGDEPLPYVFLPAAQEYRPYATLLVRTDGDPMRWASAVRDVAHQLDAELPVYGVMTLVDQLGESYTRERLGATLLSMFAGIAQLLAAIGIYGVVSYAAAGRTREMGIRVALGARSDEILNLVISQAMLPVSIGIGVGLLLALAGARTLTSYLFGVGSADPLTLGAVTLLLAATAVSACLVPARRAARVDPMVALRHE